MHFADWWVVDAEGHSGGLALIWKNEGACTVTTATKHFIDFKVENEVVGRWRYTGFYGCPERGRRQESWNIIRTLANKSKLPWCIIGDFNDLRFADKKKGGRDHPRKYLQGFGDTVSECSLLNLGFVWEKFTWEKSKGTSNWVQERLDRGLATQNWRNIFPLVEVQVIEVAMSDHLPLFLQLTKKVYVPRGERFRFENTWIREKECFKLVQSSWERAEGSGIMEKLSYFALKLEEWGDK